MKSVAQTDPAEVDRKSTWGLLHELCIWTDLGTCRLNEKEPCSPCGDVWTFRYLDSVKETSHAASPAFLFNSNLSFFVHSTCYSVGEQWQFLQGREHCGQWAHSHRGDGFRPSTHHQRAMERARTSNLIIALILCLAAALKVQSHSPLTFVVAFLMCNWSYDSLLWCYLKAMRDRGTLCFWVSAHHHLKIMAECQQSDGATSSLNRQMVKNRCITGESYGKNLCYTLPLREADRVINQYQRLDV